MKKLLFFTLFFVYQIKATAFCLQTFNAYGPAYATNTHDRTVAFSHELTRNPHCELINLQEVWSASQIDLVEEILKPLYQIMEPNRQQRIGIMSLVSGEVLEQKTYVFKLNNEDGLLDDVRELFGVKKAFHTSLVRMTGESEKIYLLNTHLHPSSQVVRLAQIMDIIEWRLNHQQYKMLLSGDFNADPNSLERALLLMLLGAHDSMHEILQKYPQDFCTYCAKNPRSWLPDNHVFDYVFYSNISQSQLDLHPDRGVVNLRGNKDDVYSDHYGLRVEFNWLAQKTPNAQDLNDRIAYTLKVIDAAQTVLMKSDQKSFLTYHQRLSDLRMQLITQRGPYWDYLRFFR